MLLINLSLFRQKESRDRDRAISYSTVPILPPNHEAHTPVLSTAPALPGPQVARIPCVALGTRELTLCDRPPGTTMSHRAAAHGYGGKMAPLPWEWEGAERVVISGFEPGGGVTSQPWLQTPRVVAAPRGGRRWKGGKPRATFTKSKKAKAKSNRKAKSNPSLKGSLAEGEKKRQRKRASRRRRGRKSEGRESNTERGEIGQVGKGKVGF